MKAVDARTMRSIDSAAVKEFKMSSVQLMENAGAGIARIVLRELGGAGGSKRVAVLTGKGNNGGDGFVVARFLKNSGVEASVYSLAGVRGLKGDAALNARVWQRMGGTVNHVRTKKDLEKYASALRHSALIVDALLGTGLKSAVKGLYAEAIGLVNGLEKVVVSVDVPSGLDATTGRVLGRAVRADVTATMALPKTGFFTYPGRELAGRVEVVDIGVPAELLEDDSIPWSVTGEADVRGILKPRAKDAHKGACGHLLVVAGSPGKTGAAYMAAVGAMRAGAGLTTLGLPEGLAAAMEAKTTEVMTVALPETPDKGLEVGAMDALARSLVGKSAVVAGPGLGATTDVARLMEKLVRTVEAPTVLDADALNSVEVGLFKDLSAPMVLTPHPGEAARLLNTTAAEVQADRAGSAVRLAERTGSTVVLKGACTVVATPDGRVRFNTTGSEALATAGTGDVLSGVIGGLLAQGYDPVDAAVAGVYLHGLAATEATEGTGPVGMMATDLMGRIPVVINRLTPGP